MPDKHRMLPGRVRDLAELRTARELQRWVRRFSPDVVHLQDGVVNDVRLLLGGTAADVLRGRYVDHRVDDLLGDIGDRFRSARQRRSDQSRQHERDCGRNQCRTASLPGEPADNAEHGRVNSSGL